MHLKFDDPIFKCCFSSTMKRKFFYLLGGLALAGIIASCSPAPIMSGSTDTGPQRAVGGGSDAESYARQAKERPGLATGWGEEKKSKLTSSTFVRSSSKPVGTDILYYNDQKGVEAMTGYSDRIEGLQTAAGDMVEWGIKGNMGYLTSYKSYILGGGKDRRFIVGGKDQTYSIVVKNRCKSALEIVASVDGLDVMDGQPASFSKRGYTVQAGETLEIKGFRTSYDRVAAFKFSSVSHSYANMRHGNTRNVGVIGIAVFTQKGVNPWTWMPNEVNKRSTAQPFATAP